MPRAMLALKRALAVRAPVQGPFKLPRACVATWQGFDACARVSDRSCAPELPQLPDYLFGDIEVCPQSPNDCQTLPGGEGVPDTDFVVFVTNQATEACGPSTLAYATKCAQDEENWYGVPNRPLSGFINFCPISGNLQADEEELEAAVDTAVHEMLHTLLMSPSLYPSFIGPDGSLLGTVVENGRVVTPAVRQASAQHFDCPSAVGAPLEDDGSQSTAGSHWESESFRGEMMVGASSGAQRAVLSPITLALAQDSGWYIPNFAAAGFLRYGHRAGCEMLGSCGLAAPDGPAAQYFCPPSQASGSQQLQCVESDTEAWCSDLPLSSCPVVLPLSNGQCTVPQNALTRFGGSTNIGVHYGPSSICMPVPDGSLMRGLRTWSLTTACMASECRADGLYLLIPAMNGDSWTPLPCPEGEFVTLGTSLGYAPGARVGPCPPQEGVCPYKDCPVTDSQLCTGNGNCFDSTCYCAVDYAGVDCSQVLCGSADDCRDGQFCSATAECTWGVAPPPPPPSPPSTGRPIVTQQPGGQNYNAMRAVRVGYGQTCVVFNDQDDDDVSDQTETSQPTGTHGEVGLYKVGSKDATLYPIKQTAPAPGCRDTLTGRTDMSLLLRAPAGIRTSDSSVNVFTTATWLAMRQAGGNATRSDTTQAVASAFGITAEDVASTDWLRVLVTESADQSARDRAANVALVSMSVVVATENVAALIGPAANGTARRGAADAFLLRLVGDAQGSPLQAQLGNATWLAPAMTQVAAQVDGANAVGALAARAVAVTVVLLTTTLVDNKAAVKAGDSAALLQEWAKTAHVGDTQFPEAAAQLGAGAITPDQYRSQTSGAALAMARAEYDVDLTQATLMEDPDGFFGNLKDGVQGWLEADQGPVPGWVWVLIGGILLLLLLCGCTSCMRKAHRRRREAQFAKQPGQV